MADIYDLTVDEFHKPLRVHPISIPYIYEDPDVLKRFNGVEITGPRCWDHHRGRVKEGGDVIDEDLLDQLSLGHVRSFSGPISDFATFQKLLEATQATASLSVTIKEIMTRDNQAAKLWQEHFKLFERLDYIALSVDRGSRAKTFLEKVLDQIDLKNMPLIHLYIDDDLGDFSLEFSKVPTNNSIFYQLSKIQHDFGGQLVLSSRWDFTRATYGQNVVTFPTHHFTLLKTVFGTNHKRDEVADFINDLSVYSTGKIVKSLKLFLKHFSEVTAIMIRRDILKSLAELPETYLQSAVTAVKEAEVPLYKTAAVLYGLRYFNPEDHVEVAPELVNFVEPFLEEKNWAAVFDAFAEFERAERLARMNEFGAFFIPEDLTEFVKLLASLKKKTKQKLFFRFLKQKLGEDQRLYKPVPNEPYNFGEECQKGKDRAQSKVNLEQARMIANTL